MTKLVIAALVLFSVSSKSYAADEVLTGNLIGSCVDAKEQKLELFQAEQSLGKFKYFLVFSFSDGWKTIIGPSIIAENRGPNSLAIGFDGIDLILNKGKNTDGMLVGPAGSSTPIKCNADWSSSFR